MVNASELRLGNLVGGLFGVCVVDRIQKGTVIVLSDYKATKGRRYADTLELEPIPLSMDILSKCGFEREQLERGTDEGGHYYSMRLSEDKYVDLSILSGDKNEEFEVFLFPYDTLRYQYLHQIQNLFHSITGKELEINL